MNKLREDLDTIVSGAFSDGMMFQANGTLTNADARKLKDTRIQDILQLFKDTVEKIMPETIYLNQYKNKQIIKRNRMLINGYNDALKEFRQNLSKILSEGEVEKEME